MIRSHTTRKSFTTSATSTSSLNSGNRFLPSWEPIQTQNTVNHPKELSSILRVIWRISFRLVSETIWLTQFKNLNTVISALKRPRQEKLRKSKWLRNWNRLKQPKKLTLKVPSPKWTKKLLLMNSESPEKSTKLSRYLLRETIWHAKPQKNN